MDAPFLIISDLHYHSWSAFAETSKTGVNSRLQRLLDATREAADALKAAGGKVIFNAGDTFHKRGSVEPSVLNPVMDLHRQLISEGFQIHAIPGNHDLEKNDSERLSNAVTALESCGVTVAHQPEVVFVAERHAVCLFPWYSTVKELLHAMEMFRSKVLSSCDGELDQMDAIIHAPIDGVLPHLPAHGLDAAALDSIGFDRVFSGHYHHHRDMGRGVYSIGALAQQTWGDIGAIAGYLLVDAENVKQVETSHPKFTELTGDETEAEAEEKAKGNFVRVRAEIDKDSELKEIREGIVELGALGVTVIPIKRTTVTRTGLTTTTASAVSMESSIKTFLDEKKARPEAHSLALDILSEARSA